MTKRDEARAAAIDPDEAPPRAPKTRDELAAETQQRVARNRAARAAGDDAAKGAPHAGGPIDEQAEHEVQMDGVQPRGEVRAGPGDAGASDAPRPLPVTGAEMRRSASASRWFIIAGAVVVAVMLLAIILS